MWATVRPSIRTTLSGLLLGLTVSAVACAAGQDSGVDQPTEPVVEEATADCFGRPAAFGLTQAGLNPRNNDSGSASLSLGQDTPITSAVFDADGAHVWLGAFGKGLLKIPMTRFGTLELENYRQYSLNSSTDQIDTESRHFAGTVKDDRITILRNGPDGSIWYGTVIAGFGVIDAQGHSLPIEEPQTEEQAVTVTPSSVAAISFAEAGRVLIGGFDGLALLDYGAALDDPLDDFYHDLSAPLPDKNVISIDRGPEGTVWVATTDLAHDPQGPVDGFAAMEIDFAPKQPSVVRSVTYHPRNSGLQTDRITSMVVGSAGHVWIGSDIGLFVLDPNGTPFVLEDDAWHMFSRDELGLSAGQSHWISAIHIITDAEILIGTASLACLGEVDPRETGVLVYLDHNGTPLDPSDDVRLIYSEPASLATSNIASITTDEQGRLLLGSSSLWPSLGAALFSETAFHGKHSICFLDPGASWRIREDDGIRCY